MQLLSELFLHFFNHNLHKILVKAQLLLCVCKYLYA